MISKNLLLNRHQARLANDFFKALRDMRTPWKAKSEEQDAFTVWTANPECGSRGATRVDLIFGSHAQLRAVAEIYASADSEEKFVRDFMSAWTMVMDPDRFDLRMQKHGQRSAGAATS